MNAIGLDIGHSAVKICLTNRAGASARLMFPSVVCPAMRISVDLEREHAERETVVLAGRRYFFGETAQIQGGARIGPTGLNEKWIYTPEHAVLLVGAWRMAQQAAGATLDDAMLVLGLPTHLFAEQRDALKKVVEQHLPVKAPRVKVMPQAMGPYQGVMLGADGKPVPGRSMGSESWAVVEVGHYTTDFGLISRGRWAEQASGTCSGMHVAAERLVRLLRERDIAVGLLEAQEVLACGTVRHFGRRLEVKRECDEALCAVVDDAVDSAARLFEPWAQGLDGVIVAGGGAGLVFEALARRWPHARLAEHPRYAIAEGMRRFGQALIGVQRLVAVSR